MRKMGVNWTKAGQIAAGGLLVIALAISLPGLIGGQKPPPVEPDVGLGATGTSGAEAPVVKKFAVRSSQISVARARAAGRKREAEARRRRHRKAKHRAEQRRRKRRAADRRGTRGRPTPPYVPVTPAPAPTSPTAPATEFTPG